MIQHHVFHTEKPPYHPPPPPPEQHLQADPAEETLPEL